MNPICNLPENEQAAVLGLFRGQLTGEEEQQIKTLFPHYLFFRNEYPEDGWNVSDPVRWCTCTSCGESFEAVRGNYARGKLHNEECNCPSCGARVTGKAVYKFGYTMNSLEAWVKAAVAYVSEDGALLIEAGNARRRFTHDELTGEIDWWPEKRYYFGNGTAQMWEQRVTHWGCGWEDREVKWLPKKTVCEPFLPNYQGYCTYEGDYAIVGLAEAVRESELRYCQIMDFYEYEYAAKLYELKTARWMVKYLGWYVHYPQIEMAVKLGLAGAVCELIQDGRKNARLLNWDAAEPAGFLRMSRADARTFRKNGMEFSDLKVWRTFGKGLTFGRFLGLVSQVNTTANLQEISGCAKTAGITLEKGVRYVCSLQSECARYAVPMGRIIETWKDYLSMAGLLEYDLTEPTVAMPRDLQARHDAAADIIRHQGDEVERKKYAKRRKALEKRFGGFILGGLRIVIPGCAQEIVDEGQTLKHCVGGYAARHMAGSTTILFLRHERRPERSFLTIELYNSKGQWKIQQIHGYRNENYDWSAGKRGAPPAEKYAWFLEPWLEWVNEGSPRDKAGRPILKTEEIAV